MHEFTEPTPAGLAGRRVVEVFVSGWEIECCAPPPAVGAQSSWRLEFVVAGGRYPDTELDRDSTWLVTRRPDGSTQLTDGPVTALWADHAGTAPAAGRVALRGHLYGNAHGPAPENAPVTTGEVRRIRVARREFELVEPRRLEPVPGTLTLTDVQRSPRWFYGNGGGEATGVLLDLAVDRRPG